MSRILVSLVVLALAGCVASHGKPLRELGRTPTGKRVGLYADPRYVPSERAQVTPDEVTRALRSSGSFSEDDTRAIAGTIAAVLAEIEADQRIIIIAADAIDPPRFHVFVQGGELQVATMRGDHEISRHASALANPTGEPTHVAGGPAPHHPPAHPPAKPEPRPEPKPESKPEPKPEPKPEAKPEPKPEPKPEAKPEPKPEPKPAPAADRPKDTAKPKPKPKPRPKTKDEPRLSEAEVRKRLEELDRLRARGLITEDEYQAKRKALLERL